MKENIDENTRNYSQAALDMGLRYDFEGLGVDDITHLDIIKDMESVRRTINDGYSSSIKSMKEKAISNRVWDASQGQDFMELQRYYDDNVKRLMDANDNVDIAEAYKILTYKLLQPKPLMGKYSEKTQGVELPAYKMNTRLASEVFKFLNSGKRQMDGLDAIFKQYIREQESIVNQTNDRASESASTHFNQWQDGYNYNNLGKHADVVRSLAGPFSTPFWKQYKDKMFNNKRTDLASST